LIGDPYRWHVGFVEMKIELERKSIQSHQNS
jgi:hypothetical protein